MKKATAVSVTLLSLAANLALAAGGDDQGRDHQWHQWQNGQRHEWQIDEWHDERHDERAVSAPEIDPGQAMGAR